MATTKQASQYARESAFVFIGTIVKSKAATMENIATDNTAIVRVERVISSPEIFSSLGGHQITARFKRSAKMKKGESMTFFSNGWIFGESIAVDVVGTVKNTDRQAASARVRNATVSGDEDVLRARIASARLAVAGRVVELTKSDQRPLRISEHDPNWHTATIAVDEVIKGKKSVKSATVLFPQSDDVRWYKVPKYSLGQQGVWLLQPGQNQDPRGIAPKVLTAIPAGRDVLTTVHRADFLPLHELEHVKALVAE